jgi:Voltage-dependent anion channel
MLAVATVSLALLGATLGFADRTGWLVYAALAALGLGLCFYTFVLSRFQFRQLAVGLGDHWVTGGALAISTLATGRIVLAAERTDTLTGPHDALQTTALVLWCLTMAWLPALIAAEILRPRLQYDMRRWSTVFPFGMYAASSFIVGIVCKIEGISTFAQVWVWIALAAWLLVFGAMVSRAPTLARASPSAAGVRT